MAKYEVEWSLSARGVWEIDAESAQEAEEQVGSLDTDLLFNTADRFDFETYPTKMNSNEKENK